MNRLSDIIEMGGNLYEEAWNNGRREALREINCGKFEMLEEANRSLGEQIDSYEKIRLTQDEEIHRLTEKVRRYEEQLNMLHEMRQKMEAETSDLRERLDKLAEEIDRKDEMIEKQSRALAIYRVPTPRNCPFCGGPAEVHQLHKDEWYVACGNSDCPVNPETNTFDTETDAIEAWNHSYDVPKVTCDWR